jgi:stress response protein YsnF
MKRPSALVRRDPGTDGTAAPLASDDRVTLPVVEERAEVGKRVVETARVRIRKRVETREEPLELTAWRDEVQVEHVAVGRVVDSAPPVRHEGNVTIVPVLEEVVVTVRQLVLKEELHISTRRKPRHERRTVRLRRERIEVDRVAVGGDSDPGTS